MCLLLGATYPDVFNAVVSFVPSGYVWGANKRDAGAVKEPAWTLNGDPVAFVPSKWDDDMNADFQQKVESGEPIPLTPGFLTAIDAVEDLEPYTIPVERIGGAVLLISGADDQMWPCADFSEQIMARLQAHNFPHPYKHLRYENTGHFISTPGITASVRHSRHPLIPANFAFGGETAAQARANADSWQQVLAFLQENL